MSRPVATAQVRTELKYDSKPVLMQHMTVEFGRTMLPIDCMPIILNQSCTTMHE